MAILNCKLLRKRLLLCAEHIFIPVVNSAATLAILSKDLEICRQMFTNGAIKPLLNVTDPDKGDAACLLSGLGCVTQLCKYDLIILD